MNHLIRSIILVLLPFGCYLSTCVADSSTLRTITTSGQGIATAQADMADLQMQISATSKTANSAKKSVDEVINSALKAMQEIGIAKDQLVASSIRLVPNYQFENRERIFTGYQASRDLTVALKKLDSLDQVLESATAAGINNVLSIQLKSSKEEALKSKALQLAIEDSKQKARQLASAYGAELGNIQTINYQTNSPMVSGQSAMAMVRTLDESAGGQYLHDEIEVRDQIHVVFELIITH